jgi:hypothetical protein
VGPGAAKPLFARAFHAALASGTKVAPWRRDLHDARASRVRDGERRVLSDKPNEEVPLHEDGRIVIEVEDIELDVMRLLEQMEAEACTPTE